MIEVRKVEGLDVLARRLQALPNKLRRRALRNALAKAARLVRDEARAIRRRSSRGTARVFTNYTRGSVERAISVRTSKNERRAGNVGVYINVRPIRFGAGRYNPNDPFYWRFLEFGTRFMDAQPFLQPSAAKLNDGLAVFAVELGKQLQKLESNGDDPL